MSIKFEEVMRAPVVSTEYVTEDDLCMLVPYSSPDNPVIAYDYGQGFFVHINSDDCREDILEELAEYGYSEKFAILYEACIEQDMQFLRLDCDGGRVIGL